jgi:hypothetical protein
VNGSGFFVDNPGASSTLFLLGKNTKFVQRRTK